ncbi:MAG: GntR family transcriptional regulator [Burkholderiales bacterium]|nr:GntR family transcriptional regulator [Burkholderiales bacterium]MCW5576745.1 GntR family transcriptional regulator [Burkholderiales bacterium]MCW5603704.1 GntR family transcriptional regulator [Burkholderiales bacterium]
MSAGTDNALNQTLPEKIAEMLAERIVDGRYPPGSRLVEAVLSEEFGSSHGPVRDALRLLQSAGLVTILPYRGAVVSDISVREVRELYQVRAALVGLRARWIAEDPQRDDLVGKVAAPIAQLRKLAGRDTGGYTRTALLVNRSFTESLTNRWLRTTLSALMLQTSRYTRLALASPAHQRYSAKQWQALLDAIRAGDGDRAEHIAAALSQATRDQAIKFLEQESGTAGTARGRKKTVRA